MNVAAIESDVMDAYNSMQFSLKAYKKSRLGEMKAQFAWDEWYLTAVAQGEVAGKNAEERLGNAILAQPDLWLTLQQAREQSFADDLDVKLARNNDKYAGRMVMLNTGTYFEGQLLDTTDG